MPDIQLTYFDFHGGRGEPARLAFAIGGIDFHDRRIPLAEWPSVREQMPFHAVPVLTVDGQTVTQSSGINRYAGKLAGLYPEDAWQAALCDEAMDVVQDAVQKTVASFGLSGEELKSTRLALVEGPLPFFLERMQSRLERAGGQYFADGRLTVADLAVMVWVRSLRSGVLDHVPTDLVDRVAPALVEHLTRVNEQAKIVEYYGS